MVFVLRGGTGDAILVIFSSDASWFGLCDAPWFGHFLNCAVKSFFWYIPSYCVFQNFILQPAFCR